MIVKREDIDVCCMCVRDNRNECRTSSFRRGGCLVLRWGNLTLVAAEAAPSRPRNAQCYIDLRHEPPT